MTISSRSASASLAIHGAFLLVLVWLGTKVPRPNLTNLGTGPVPLFLPPPLRALDAEAGGGGRASSPVSRGELPLPGPRPFVLPNPQPPVNEAPLLAAAPSIVTDTAFPAIGLPRWGDPLGQIGPPSCGRGGAGETIGNGSKGPRHGGGGMGRSVHSIGGGVSAPVLIYKIEPDYSEDARKAKVQGTVTLEVTVDEHGRVAGVRIRTPVGLGLDEKAMEAVRQWRFQPGRRNGQPVAVLATVEVNFRLL